LLGYDVVAHGGTAVYDGGEPTKGEDWAFTGWKPSNANITADTDCIAQFKSTLIISDRLVEKTLSGAYYNDRITSLGQYALYNVTGLTSIEFPNVATVGDSALYFNKTNLLARVVLPSATTFSGSYFLNGASNVTHLDIMGGTNFPSITSLTKLGTLIIRKTDGVCNLSNINNMSSSCPIRKGTGYIYVPSALVDDYKAATNWSTLANRFRAIEDYPDITGGVVTNE
jgi:hypothetical protein